MGNLITWVQTHEALVFGVLFGLSEALAYIPAIKANSVFQLVYGWLQKEQTPSS